jgi:hypothetical protein
MFELDGKNQDGKKEIRYFNSFDELLEFDKKTGEIRLRNGLTLKDIKVVPKGKKENRNYLYPEEELDNNQDRVFAIDLLEDEEEEEVRLITEEDGLLLGSKGNIYSVDEDRTFTQVEQWAMIPDFPRYHVSNFGRVMGMNGKILKPSPNYQGYLLILLYKGDGSKPVGKLVHRLVAEVFLDNPNNLPCINHKDEDPQNNCVWNLEWCTQKYNTKYSIYKQEREVEQLDRSTGEVIDTFKSMNDAARQTGINQGSISLVCNGYIKQSGGYGWRYAKPYTPRKVKQVEQYNLKTGKVIARYESSYDAARHLDLGRTKVTSAGRRIKECCEEIRKSYKGFGFRYC